MAKLTSRSAAVCAALCLSLTYMGPAAEILIVDEKSQPESLTIAPGGILYAGSASSPFVYKESTGSTTAEKFVDASAEGPGIFFLGVLADAATKPLWTCQLTPLGEARPVYRALSGPIEKSLQVLFSPGRSQRIFWAPA